MVDRYGPPEVVTVRDVDDPRPGPDEVVVRVGATAVSSGDARIRGARFPKGFGPFARLAFGVRRPRRPILGGCVAGTVETLGEKVTGVAVGDRVTAMTGVRMGSHAELVPVAAERLAPTPDHVTDDQAAAVLFGGTTALRFLRDRAHLDRSDGATVLVNGASGAIGTVAVQLAARWGAEVTAVTSERNAELVRSLGAHHVIDHTTTDVTAIDQRYDVVLDAVGNISIAAGRALLRPGGTCALAVASLGETIRASLPPQRAHIAAGAAPERTADFETLLAMVAAGDLEVVIDRTLRLDEIVEAHRHVDGGHKVGNTVIRP